MSSSFDQGSTGGTSPIVVDVAGAVMGGAAQFLRELQSYLQRRPGRDVQVIGYGRRLDPKWLALREVAARRARTRIALNNVSFSAGRDNRTLLHNAWHFADPAEFESLGHRPSLALSLQTHIVRVAARRSHVLVVPCQAMAERVARHAPSLTQRLVVRPHPVSSAPWAANRRPDRRRILIPIVNAPYKRLQHHVANLLAAIDRETSNAHIVVTAQPQEFAEGIAGDPRIRFVGRLTSLDLEKEWQRATAVYFPTQLESFGYPLAQARANGLPVIALDTAQNREIAGPALRGFQPDDPISLALAVTAAFQVPAVPDPGPFDPDRYFDWLLRSEP